MVDAQAGADVHAYGEGRARDQGLHLHYRRRSTQVYTFPFTFIFSCYAQAFENADLDPPPKNQNSFFPFPPCAFPSRPSAPLTASLPLLPIYKTKNSANPFEPVLRPAMMEMLQRDFSPPLPCEPLADNAGRLRVKAQDLVTWIDAQVCLFSIASHLPASQKRRKEKTAYKEFVHAPTGGCDTPLAANRESVHNHPYSAFFPSLCLCGRWRHARYPRPSRSAAAPSA